MDDLTNQGIQALKTGDKARARSLFLSALEIDADNAQAWLWLSGAIDSEPDRLDCLDQVLRIDPNNQAAVKGRALLIAKGIVPAELREPAPAESQPAIQEKDQGGWQHEMLEEQPVAPPIPLSEMAVENQAVVMPAEAQSVEETAFPPSEPEEGEDAFRLPESFFQSEGSTEGSLPDWAAVTTAEAGGTPAFIPERAEPIPAESLAAIPAPETQAAIKLPPQTVQASDTAVTAAHPEETTLFKIRPSLVTTVVIYGLGAVILFVATLALFLTITNSSSVIVLIGLLLIVALLVAMLGILVWQSTSHQMTSFTFTNRRLYLEQGVFKRSHKSIPLKKISKVTLKQGLLQKVIGIGNLTVYSEAADGQEEQTRLADVSKAVEMVKRIDTAIHGEG